MRSFLGVPIRSADAVVGNLYLTNKRGAAEFSDEDERRLLALAAQAGAVLEQAQNLQRERDLSGRLQSLLTLVASVSTERRVDVVLQAIVDGARRLVDAHYAALGVLTDDGTHLSDFIHAGLDEDAVRRIGPLPQGLGVLGAVVIGGRTMRLEQLSEHPASVGFPPHHPDMTSFLGVPVELLGRTLGNLYLTNKRGAAGFSDEDELIVSALAAQAAVVINNARAFEREQALTRELRATDEARQAFVRHVTHELKTPLATMTGVMKLLHTHGETLADRSEELWDAALRQGGRMNEMINNLLELSRIESGRVAMSLAPVDLAVAVRSSLDQATPPGEVAVDLDVPTGLSALADGRYLDRIIVNLLTNAYRHGGGHITVAARSRRDRVVVEVADDGQGVPVEMIDRLFDRFVKGATSQGSGLGLGLARSLAEAFGGSLAYEPGADGGARFVLRLVPATGAVDVEAG